MSGSCPGVRPLTAFPEPAYLESGSWCPLCPGVSALWPTILCYCVTTSPQRELLILSILPNQPAHICIKISKRLKGSGAGLRVYTLQYAPHLCLLNSFSLLTCLFNSSLSLSLSLPSLSLPLSHTQTQLLPFGTLSLFSPPVWLLNHLSLSPFPCLGHKCAAYLSLLSSYLYMSFSVHHYFSFLSWLSLNGQHLNIFCLFVLATVRVDNGCFIPLHICFVSVQGSSLATNIYLFGWEWMADQMEP